MFKVVHNTLHTTQIVYGVKKGDKEGETEFLFFEQGCWFWTYAKFFIPITDVGK